MNPFLILALWFGAAFLFLVLRIAARKRLARRRLSALVQCADELAAHQARLAGYAELSRWVTANMLLASHRERRRGTEARA